MKATRTDRIIVGRAATDIDLNNDTNVVAKQTIRNQVNQERVVKIGRVEVDIAIGKNPVYQEKLVAPVFLRNFGESIAGKPVSSLRIYMSLSILIVSGAVASSLVYSAIRSSMVAVGRNPLSKKSIMRSLLQVVVISLVIFLCGLAGMYIILRA